MRMGKPAAIVGLAALAAGALSVGVASGAAEAITASTTDNTFTKASYVIDQGEVATLDNPAASEHNVTATGNGPDGNELFRSATISGGQAPVNGTQYLSAGTYRFICTIHSGMAADLVVTGNGAPVARPAVKLKLKSRKLDKVVSSRKLKLKLSAPTQSDGVTVSARKGARRVTAKKHVDLAAGSSRTLNLKLTGAGRKALGRLDAAKVKVTATVPFGASASAKRKLR
jgi:plastocyanin